MNPRKKLLNLKTHKSVLVFLLLLLILPILIWGLSSRPLELRKRAVDPTPTPARLNIVCWNKVIVQDRSPNWPDGCLGRIHSEQVCTQALVPLNADEQLLYNQWIEGGRPPIPGCGPVPTCIPRPACLDAKPRCLMPETIDMCPPLGCHYQFVQCIQAPCDPILVCPSASPTPKDTMIPTLTTTPKPTPTRSSTTLDVRVRFAGVTGSEAEGASITLRFTNAAFDAITSPIRVTHIGQGIYKAIIDVRHRFIPTGTGYWIIVKGEKHVGQKFCKYMGQTSPCTQPSQMNIDLPASDTLSFDFSGITLSPGDLPPQDGVVNSNDFTVIKSLMAKPCSELSTDERYKADLDYNGCINIRDAFLLRKTLESRYDEY